MSDEVLRWVWDGGRTDEITTALIVRNSQSVSGALNDQVYEPELTDPQAWCRGFPAGFIAEITPWTPPTAALPELLKLSLSNAEDYPLDSANATMAEAAQRIHAFWLSHRRHGSNADGLLGQLIALSRTEAALPNQRLH